MSLVAEDGGLSYEAGLECGCICNFGGLSCRGSVGAMIVHSDEAAAHVNHNRRYPLVHPGPGRRNEESVGGRSRCRCVERM
ncbi:hypothetical protein MRB53_007287 [Persea americana]|uniref:Uncharacterized protein n=1 Tax=Persea americana TaxID=3435 RepID=A0ACC2MJM9_PERAE|nr:hypothetical protein MRB53_007287 [Persea americana]